MGLQLLDFAIVIYDDKVDPSWVFDVLETMNICPLNIIAFSDWVEDTDRPEFDILCIKKNGEIVLAGTACEKMQLRKQIELQYLQTAL
jgi:hypothetical protein